MAPQPVLSFISVALFVIGLTGNGFELRKIRMSTTDENISPRNMFLNKRNLKWYALIGIAFGLWAVNNLY